MWHCWHSPPAHSHPAAVPLHLRAPQDVLLFVHEDGEMLVFALLDGVGASGDSSHFAELQEAQACHAWGYRAPWCTGQAGRGLTGRVTPFWGTSATIMSLLLPAHGTPSQQPKEARTLGMAVDHCRTPTAPFPTKPSLPPAAPCVLLMLTFAILPCSRHSCSSSLSLTVDASGLGKRDGLGRGWQCLSPCRQSAGLQMQFVGGATWPRLF